MLDLTNIRTINSQLISAHTRMKKYFGQHFLLSKKIINAIIEASEVKNNENVLEIGPGLGVLTLALATAGARVVTVEKDEALLSLLQENINLAGFEDRVEIIHDDILNQQINNYPFDDYKIVANLPYQITADFFWKFLYEEEKSPQLLVVMIQKEVADRLVATPGNMSLLSVLVQLFATVRIVTNVKKTQFFPPPRVDSTVVKLTSKPIDPDIQKELFFKLVKAGFESKRKKLKNNLRKLQVTERHLEEARISVSARAQELGMSDWLNLYKIVYTKDNKTHAL